MLDARALSLAFSLWVLFEDFGAEWRDGSIIFLFSSGGGPSFCDGCVYQLDELINLLGVFECEVVFLHKVSF